MNPYLESSKLSQFEQLLTKQSLMFSLVMLQFLQPREIFDFARVSKTSLKFVDPNHSYKSIKRSSVLKKAGRWIRSLVTKNDQG